MPRPTPRRNRSRSRCLRNLVERLEGRTLLAADLRVVDGVTVARVDWNGERVDMLAGRWVVRLGGYNGYLLDQETRARQTVSQASRAFTVVTHLADDGLFLVQGPQDMAIADAVAELSALPGFVSLVPDFRYELTATTPNDTSFASMWGLNNTGQSGGTVDADIDAPEAWDTQTGSASVVVGMVDSGIDYNHADLNDNIFTNTLEIAGNSIDDDANGFVDDTRGWDWWGNLSNVGTPDNNPIDQNGHGTHTAGTVGAEGNNGTGVTGVNWDVTLIPLKIGGPGNSVSGAGAVAAMNYVRNLKTRAVQPVNVRVTNHSWGGAGFDANMNNAIAQHNTNGIVTVCAAGNNGSNIESTGVNFYPAEYDQPNNISVGNHTRTNVRNPGSNFGQTAVDLFAPGTDVLSSVPGGGYALFTGTSMAAPHVAGVAALLFAAAPGATGTAVKTAILAGVETSAAYTTICLSGGRLSADNALALLSAAPAAPAAPDLSAASDSGASNSDNITNDNTPTFTGSGAGIGNTILVFANGTQVGSAIVSVAGTWSVTTSPLTDGVKSMTARQQNASGTSPDSPALSVTIDTAAPTISGPAYSFATSPHFLRVQFNENVGASLAAADFQVSNQTAPGSLAVTHVYDAGLNTARVNFTGLPVLPDADFRLDIPTAGAGGGVQDVAGNSAAAFGFDFFFLMGDANHDRIVNLADFNTLAANFGQSPRDFTQGDFTYDGTVNLADFNVLAARFGSALAAGARSSSSPFGGSPITGDDRHGEKDPLDDLLG